MKPILVHIHIYYPEFWPELRSNLATLSDYPFELYVTTANNPVAVINEIKELYPNARILHIENRGYDVGPFIHVLNQVDLGSYSYVIKLHTKRDIYHLAEPGWTYYSPYYLYGKRWRERLLSFIKPENFQKCLQAFQEDASLGMVNHYSLIVPGFHAKEKTLLAVQQGAEQLLARANIKLKECRYIKGTMFIARAELFQRIKDIGLTTNDFPAPDTHHNIDNPAHYMEIVLGCNIVAQGFKIQDVFTPNADKKVKFGQFWGRIRKKLYKNYISKKGRHVIKIAKIMIWNAKTTH